MSVHLMLLWIKRLSLVVFLLISLSSYSQENGAFQDDWDDWQEEEEEVKAYHFKAFIEASRGQFTQGNDVVGRAQSLSEIRGRFELKYEFEQATFNASGELQFDDVINENTWQTRELNFQSSLSENLDIKIGRQVLTWGTGDYLFLNDLFAKDWQSFFAGRDDEYLKASQDSLRLTHYLDNFLATNWLIDLVWTADFTADTYITGERFSFYSPISGGLVAPANNFRVSDRNDDQLSMRFKTSIHSMELALYGYVGYWPTPQGVQLSQNSTDSVTELTNTLYFPRLNVWGASVLLPFSSGILNSEFAYYDSKESDSGRNAFVAHSQLRYLLGYSQELVKNLTLSGQYYLEKTLNYSRLEANATNPDSLVDEYRHLITLRNTYLTHLQKLTWSLFAFYSPSDEDFYIRPSLAYRYNDNWSASIGGNLFNGQKEQSFFGQHEENSNVYFRVRFSF